MQLDIWQMSEHYKRHLQGVNVSHRPHTMSEETFVRVTLRLPKSLHERIAAEADRKTSTTNAEVVMRLEKSLLDGAGHSEQQGRTSVSKEDLAALKAELETMLDRKLLSLVMALNTGASAFVQKKD